jgi:molybdate transport system substrate-binding protein
MRLLAGLALSLLLAVVPAAAQRAPLVLAAASLQESMTAAADAWARKGHPRPVVSFASSAALARQVAAGARADIFVSADEEWMDDLAAKRLIVPASRARLIGNRLVIVAARGNRVTVPLRPARALARALGTGPLALADPRSVPAGRYAQAALERLGVWQAMAPRVVGAENVRAALGLVERGAAPLGIVYATDARASGAVRVVATFPAATHPPIRYPIALLKTASSPDAAGFRRFLLSDEGKRIFVRYGFTTR